MRNHVGLPDPCLLSGNPAPAEYGSRSETYRQVLQEFEEQVVQLPEDFFKREPPPPIPKVEACFLIRPLPHARQAMLFSPPKRTRDSNRQPH